MKSKVITLTGNYRKDRFFDIISQISKYFSNVKGYELLISDECMKNHSEKMIFDKDALRWVNRAMRTSSGNILVVLESIWIHCALLSFFCSLLLITLYESRSLVSIWKSCDESIGFILNLIMFNLSLVILSK